MTKEQYICATIFLDHYSDLTFTYLQKSLSVQDTLKAKRAFEAFSRRHGVKIQHYHSDNGRFADKDLSPTLPAANKQSASTAPTLISKMEMRKSASAIYKTRREQRYYIL